MRSHPPPQVESSRDFFSRLRFCRIACRPAALLVSCASLLGAPLLLSGAMLAAQSNPAPTPVPAHASIPTAAHRHLRAHKERAEVKPVPQPAPPPTPVVPAAPNWPANDPPAEASVLFDSRGLHIAASNSSLTQILKQVSTETGARVEGLGADQRVFGTYGPGPARVVLSQLLDGSGYNVLMIGDRGEGTPREIVLSPQSAAAPHAAGGAAAPSGENAVPSVSGLSPQEMLEEETQARQVLREQQEPSQNTQN